MISFLKEERPTSSLCRARVESIPLRAASAGKQLKGTAVRHGQHPSPLAAGGRGQSAPLNSPRPALGASTACDQLFLSRPETNLENAVSTASVSHKRLSSTAMAMSERVLKKMRGELTARPEHRCGTCGHPVVARVSPGSA